MFCLPYLMIAILVTFCEGMCVDYASKPAVQLLQTYIQINTTSGNDLSPAVKFWNNLAEINNLPINIYEFVGGYPVIVIKWAGTNCFLKSIMLNSHMDVVPANEEDGWTYSPYSGHIDKYNNIYGRGTQDMKSVSVQYFEAMLRLTADNILLRDVYMVLVPDEEIGAESGMIPFLQSEEFAALNVGFELDEGVPYPKPIILVFYQDKVAWQIQIDCYGSSAHGATFPAAKETATGKCHNVINSLLQFRDDQYEIARNASILNAGIYTSVNLNKLSGGVANNVIPSHVSLTFDIRLGTTVNEETFEAQLQKWITPAGDNVTLTYILKNHQSPATVTNASNPYWTAIKKAANKLNITILPIVAPGSTDARHVRNFGIPAFGLSPLSNTPLLLHSVNEYINAEVFLRGIDIYEKIIHNLANIPSDESDETPSNYLYKTIV